MSVQGVVLWAGKPLDSADEAATRALVDLMRRSGDDEGAEAFARFLPERDDEWTPDELEVGAHAGPWLSVGAGPRPE